MKRAPHIATFSYDWLESRYPGMGQRLFAAQICGNRARERQVRNQVARHLRQHRSQIRATYRRLYGMMVPV